MWGSGHAAFNHEGRLVGETRARDAELRAGAMTAAPVSRRRRMRPQRRMRRFGTGNPGGRIRGVDCLGLEPLVGTLLSPPITGPARNDMRRALHLTSCSRKSWGHSERPTLSCRRSSPRSREWRFARCRLVDLDQPSRCSTAACAGSRVRALNRMGAQRLDRPVNPSAQRCGTESWYPASGQQRPRGPIPERESVVELSAPSEITPIRIGDAPDRVACSRRLSRLRDPAV